jgi:hypothetical protein
MANTLWLNFNHGPIAADIYTPGATENSPHAPTFEASGCALAAPGWLWGARTVLDVGANWWAAAGPTAGYDAIGGGGTCRILMLFSLETYDFRQLLILGAPSGGDGRLSLRLIDDGGTPTLDLYSAHGGWAGENNWLGAAPALSTPTWIEIISDPGNATPNQRLRARSWALGGSPPVFTDPLSANGSAGDPAAFTSMVIGEPGDWGRYYIGQLIIDDDPTVDLSAEVANEDYGGGGPVTRAGAAWGATLTGSLAPAVAQGTRVPRAHTGSAFSIPLSGAVATSIAQGTRTPHAHVGSAFAVPLSGSAGVSVAQGAHGAFHGAGAGTWPLDLSGALGIGWAQGTRTPALSTHTGAAWGATLAGALSPSVAQGARTPLAHTGAAWSVSLSVLAAPSFAVGTHSTVLRSGSAWGVALGSDVLPAFDPGARTPAVHIGTPFAVGVAQGTHAEAARVGAPWAAELSASLSVSVAQGTRAEARSGGAWSANLSTSVVASFASGSRAAAVNPHIGSPWYVGVAGSAEIVWAPGAAGITQPPAPVVTFRIPADVQRIVITRRRA